MMTQWITPKLEIFSRSQENNLENNSQNNGNPSDKTQIILIHGTFGEDAEWYQQGNEFYEKIKSNFKKKNPNKELEMISFSWGGELSAISRMLSAGNLVKEILKAPNNITIGHSHGGNIVNIASQVLKVILSDDENSSHFGNYVLQLAQVLKDSEDEENKKRNPEFKPSNLNEIKIQLEKMIENISLEHKDQITRMKAIRSQDLSISGKTYFMIDQSYLLATPVNEQWYLPCDETIRNTYLLYSQGDLVTTVLPMYKDKYSDEYFHIKNLNTCFKVKDKIIFPSHSEMKAHEIADVLLDIPELVSYSHKQNLNLKIDVDQESASIKRKNGFNVFFHSFEIIWKNFLDLFSSSSSVKE